jgi:hypothetical protein
MNSCVRRASCCSSRSVRKSDSSQPEIALIEAMDSSPTSANQRLRLIAGQV